MRKLNNMTRAVILLAICVLSIAAISFSWLSRPLTNANNQEDNYGELKLSTIKGAADSGGTGAVSAYTRMNNSSTAVTAKTFLATIDAETGKYDKANEVKTSNNVSIGTKDCTYMITELTNSSKIPTRVSLKIPELTEDTKVGIAMFCYAPYKDKADNYIVKNIEVIQGSPVTVKWYFTNSGDSKDIKFVSLPTVEYFR